LTTVLALLIALTVVSLLFTGCALYVVGSYAFAFGPLRFVLATAYPPRSGPPPRLWRAAVVELATTLLVMPLWPLWSVLGASYAALESGQPPEHSAARRPVILLHGFAMNQTQWWWMGRRLQKRGSGPLYGMTYFSLQSVARSARHLSQFVERVREKEHGARVDIVAHSLGGVVARYYIERLGGEAAVERVITIGSPHHGSATGRLAPLIPATRDMGSASPLLAELGPLREARPRVSYTSIWSRADAIIVPPESSAISPAGEDCIFDDLGHLTLVVSPRVIDLVAERLRPEAKVA
jgi:triacylglycerol esterase/lipase EstA (alpha/beta hydrolase family)